MKKPTMQALRSAAFAIAALLVSAAITYGIAHWTGHLPAEMALYIVPVLTGAATYLRRYWIANSHAADPGKLLATVLEDYSLADIEDIIANLKSPATTRATPAPPAVLNP